MIHEALALTPDPSRIVEGALGIGATLFTGFQGWQGIMLVRLQRRVDSMHTALCGHPEIEGDRGIAGRVTQTENRLDGHDQLIELLVTRSMQDDRPPAPEGREG